MPELMISPTPASPGGTGNANALSQSDAGSRAGESAKTDSGTESPFAAVLKSRMNGKTPAADAAGNPGSAEVATRTNADNSAISLDSPVLFPFLGTSPDATASATPVAGTDLAAANPDEKLLPGLQAAKEPDATQLLATPLAMSSAVMATGPRTQHIEAREETLTSPRAARTDGTGRVPGKIVLDPAISADVGHKSGESNAPELAASDFHALLERATAMTPGGPGPASGSSSSPSLHIDTPLGQAGWHDEVGQKLTWMVGNGRQQADLVLNPPQLGRVEVSLTMNGDQATAIFTSSNPAVREALESSLHRLREVLADAGVSLGQTQVGSESPNQSARSKEPDYGLSKDVRYAMPLPLPGVAAVAGTSAGRGMIDVFA